MSTINGILSLYGGCAKSATIWLRKNWILLPAVFLAYMSWILVAILVSPLGPAGAMLLGILELVLITGYYSAVDDCIRHQRISWADFKRFDVTLFFAFVRISFILWLVEYVLRSLVLGLEAGWIIVFFKLGVLFAFNPLPEVVYRQRGDGLEAFQRAFAFTRDNLIVWYLPFLILIIPWMTFGSSALLIITTYTHTLFPSSILVQTPKLLLPTASGQVTAIVGLFLAHWFTLFRGFLYEQLETGSVRRFDFMNKMR